MRDEIPFTDDEIEAHFDEQTVISATIERVVFTRDSIDDFRAAQKAWREAGRAEEDTLGGHPALLVVDARIAPGQPRKNFAVIDYGTVRAVMS